MIETKKNLKTDRVNPPCAILYLFSFFILLNLYNNQCNAQLKNNSLLNSIQNYEIKKIDNWQYFTGDLDKDKYGNYVFGNLENDEGQWKNSSQSLFPNNEKKILWLRTKLPDIDGISPAIFVNRAKQIMEVYFDGKKIFDNREFAPVNKSIRLLGYRWYIVKLPNNISGQYLYTRFYSEGKTIGFVPPISIGLVDSFLSKIATANIPDIVIGTIIILSAIVMLAIFTIAKRQRFYLGLSIFFFSTGLFVLLNNPYIYLLIHNIYLVSFSTNFALFFAPFFYMAAEDLILDRYKKIMQWLWKIHIVFIALVLACIQFPKLFIGDFLTPFFILLLITSNFAVILMFKSASIKKIDSLILLIGTIVFSALGTTEIILYYTNYYVNVWYTHTHVLQWGVFAFVISLIALTVYRYFLEVKQKQEMQEQLVLQQNLTLDARQREITTREQFTQQLLQSQDDERKRISLELHDAIGQELLIIKNMASLSIRKHEKERGENISNQYINDISETTSSVIESVRNLSRNLHPYQLDNLGLTEALEAIVSRVENNSEIRFEYNIEPVDGLFVREKELHIYRILQEIINNILKHSKASEAGISITKNENRITMNVTDNGIGFPNAEADNGTAKMPVGFGISGMRERVRILHGTMKINQGAVSGTEIKIEIPVDDKK